MYSSQPPKQVEAHNHIFSCASTCTARWLAMLWLQALVGLLCISLQAGKAELCVRLIGNASTHGTAQLQLAAGCAAVQR